jgi:hypothetical protein
MFRVEGAGRPGLNAQAPSLHRLAGSVAMAGGAPDGRLLPLLRSIHSTNSGQQSRLVVRVKRSETGSSALLFGPSLDMSSHPHLSAQRSTA